MNLFVIAFMRTITNGDSILKLLDLDMVLDFPVDPMHLVDLGVCRKLLLTWICGPLERRLPKNLVEIISARLELLRDYIPREFARLSRSLKFRRLNLASLSVTLALLYLLVSCQVDCLIIFLYCMLP